ncbi:MAG: adenosylcobinamide-GDP ribazoletransferase [Acetivibrionales bacterium]
MRLLKRFLLMIQFLTSIPLNINLEADAEDYGKGLVFAPLVGLLIGGILAGCCYIFALVFPRLVSAVFTIVVYIILTGGLHLDGLGDTFDGIFSNRPKERILDILRDSRVGTNAVLAIVSLLMVNTAMLSAIDKHYIFSVLILMPSAGRIGSLVGSGVSTYARSGEGLGKSFIDYCGTGEIIAGMAISLPVFYAFFGVPGLAGGVFSLVTAYLLVKLFSKKIGGATGDILGAVCELNQTLFLMFAYMMIYFLK